MTGLMVCNAAMKKQNVVPAGRFSQKRKRRSISPSGHGLNRRKEPQWHLSGVGNLVLEDVEFLHDTERFFVFMGKNKHARMACAVSRVS